MSDGIALSIAGISIVYVALVLISLFVAAMPRLLGVLNAILPETPGHHGHQGPAARRPGDASARTTLAVAVAVAAHHHRSRSR